MSTITLEPQTVQNYPYGRLRTQATFSIEFKKNRGFRSVFQTINPKTGRINKPKKGTYRQIMFMINNDGFVKFHGAEFYELEKFNKVTEFLYKNFDIFTQEQAEYLYTNAFAYLKQEIVSLKAYCGVDIASSFPLVKEATEYAIQGVKNSNINLFDRIKVDHEALISLKKPNYKPFLQKEVIYT